MSDSAIGGRFDPSRRDAAAKADGLTAQCYTEYFDASLDDVYSVERAGDGDGSAEHGALKMLDFGGCDIVIDAAERFIHVEQRVRPSSATHEVDLSLCTDNGVGKPSKFDEWRGAYESGLGYIPDVIGFGVYDHVLGVFQQFAIINTESVVAAVVDGGLDGEEYATGDGRRALYLSMEDLREHAEVLAEWDGVVPQ